MGRLSCQHPSLLLEPSILGQPNSPIYLPSQRTANSGRIGD